MAEKTSKSKSPWTVHFIRIDDKKVKCNLCNVVVAASTSNTSNLKAHLKSHHKKEFAEIEQTVVASSEKRKRQLQEEETPKATKQKNIHQFFRSREVWDSTDQRKIRADKKLVEMICIDMQPASIVEDTGFKEFVELIQPAYALPTRRDLRTVLLPSLYDETKCAVKKKLAAEDTIGITTDHWTSRSNDAYMAVTVHGLSADFEIYDFCLDVKHMPQSHNAENISDELMESVKRWLPVNENMKIYVVSDNASNVQAAWKLLPDTYTPLNCFAHTLQLVIKDSLKEFPAAKNVIAKCQNIAKHFHHSAKSTHLLSTMQQTMTLPNHKLKTECETRWNSTYYLVERIVEQKNPLNAVLASITKVNNLTAHEWKTAEEYVEVLRPFEEATKIMSATRYATISMVIPVLNSICEQMNSAELDVFGGCVVRNIHKRWPNYEEHKLFSFSTLLDPRFKQYGFTSEKMKETAKEGILFELVAEKIKETSQGGDTRTEVEIQKSDSKSDAETCTEAASSSSVVRPKTTDFWSSLKQKVAKQQPHQQKTDENELKAVLKFELNSYLEEPVIDPSDCPFKWWRRNGIKFPNVSVLARSYLLIPATSVPSERLFSKAGLVISDRRSSLKPSNAEQLVFLSHNLKALKVD